MPRCQGANTAYTPPAMALYDREYMRDDEPTLQERLRRISAFQWFFGANIVVFIAQFLLEIGATHEGSQFVPQGAVSIAALTQGQVWTPFTYMFVHGSVGHILFNMFMLWFAGKRVQEIYGERRFAIIYILSGLVGAALQLGATAVAQQPDAGLLGASASIMGLVLACAVAIPEEEINFLFMFIVPVRVRMWTLAKFLLISNIVLGALDMMHLLPGSFTNGGAQTAYLAHVGGALAGWYYARLLGYGGGLPANLDGFAAEARAVRRPAMAGTTRRRRPVVELDEEAIRRQAANRNPVVDLMRDEVDPILDKITEQGMHSLTDDELRILKRASRQMPDGPK